MKTKLNKFFHSRFFDQPINISIITSFLIIVLMQTYFKNSEWIKENFYKLYHFVNESNLLIEIIGAIIPFVPIIISLLIKKCSALSNNKSIFSGRTEETRTFPGLITQEMIDNKKVTLNHCQNKPIMLDRQKQCANIIKHIKSVERKEKTLNCLFLTGSSGSGKSILLNNFLKDILEKSNEKCIIINKDYNEYEKIYQDIKDNSIIIMDQFEDSLDNPKIYRYIKKIISESQTPLFFIFSFPQEYFDRIHLSLTTVIESNEYNPGLINSSTYFMRNDDHDIKQLLHLVNTFVGRGQDVEECFKKCVSSLKENNNLNAVINSEAYKQSTIFLCSILAKIKLGISPLVEFSIISYIYEIYKDEINKNLEYYILDTDNVIDLYLDKWVNKFPNPETAQIILYLLSDRNIYIESDLKCVTFEPDYYFNNDSKCKLNMIAAMNSNSLICVNENFSDFEFGIYAVHDYVGVKINDYCFKRLSHEIRQNIDHYRKIMSQNRIGRMHVAESREKRELLRRYNTNFCGSKNKWFVNFCIFIIMIASIVLTYFNGSQGKTENEYTLTIMTAFNCLFSTYYIYNLLIQFFRVLNMKQFLLIALMGTISVVSCFAIPRIWGISLGIEVVTLGLCLFCLKNKTVNMAQKEFARRGLLYVVLGVLVISLGIAYAMHPSLLYHVFFIMYVFMCNWSHIKYHYMISSIGVVNTIEYQ